MRFKNNKKIILVLLLLTTIYLIPHTTHAANLIPCDGVTVPCDFNALMQLFSNLINFVVGYLALPLATVTFIYAGFKIMTSGDNPSGRKDGFNMMRKVAIGFFVLLAAWLIVHTILLAILNPSISVPLQF